MWHLLEKPNLNRSPERSPGLLVFTLAFHFAGEKWKCFQLQVGFFLSGWTSATCTCCLSQRRERWWASSRERGQVGNGTKQLSQPNSRKKNIICCRKSISAPVEVAALALNTWTSSFASTQIPLMTQCQGRPGCAPVSKLSPATLSLSTSSLSTPVFNVIYMTFVPSSQQLATQWMTSYLSGKKKEQCKLLMGWRCLSLSSKKKKTWDTARSTTTQVSAVNP